MLETSVTQEDHMLRIDEPVVTSIGRVENGAHIQQIPQSRVQQECY